MNQRPRWDPESAPTFWLNHVSRLLMRHFDRRLRALGLGMAYFPVVVALGEHGELTQRELAERARVEQPSMAALLARMERDGLISRAPHPTDKRAVHFALSTRARASIPKAKQSMRDVADQALEGFSEKEKAVLLGFMRRMVENLGADATEA
jgi:DNA-binding MarR family transcriptional regulator